LQTEIVNIVLRTCSCTNRWTSESDILHGKDFKMSVVFSSTAGGILLISFVPTGQFYVEPNSTAIIFGSFRRTAEAALMSASGLGGRERYTNLPSLPKTSESTGT
jgi:hypothetical protein